MSAPGPAPRAASPRERDVERDTAEATLLARLANGDREGPLIELYDRYGVHIYRLGLRLLGASGPAEELVQETFVRLWRSAGRFDPVEGTARAWVFLLARRTAVDLQRRAAARPPSALADADERADAPGDPAWEDAADRALVGIEVRDALEGLSPKHREVLELSYDEGLSQSQIADRLGVPLGTVKTRTYHGLRALRDELDRRGLRA